MPRKPALKCKHCHLPLERGPAGKGWMHRYQKALFMFCQLPIPKSGSPLRAEPKEKE